MNITLQACQVIVEIIYHIATIVILGISLIIVNNFASKDKQVDVTQTIREDKRELFRDASILVTTRFYDQFRFIGKIRDTFSPNNISYKHINELNIMFNKYMESVIVYNIKVRIISQQIRYVFNEDLSKLFSRENDKDQSSISGSFTLIHKKILKLRENSWKEDKNLISELESDNYSLLKKSVKFLQEMARLTFAKDKILEEHSL